MTERTETVKTLSMLSPCKYLIYVTNLSSKVSTFYTLHFHNVWLSSEYPPWFYWPGCLCWTQRSWWHPTKPHHSCTAAFVFLHYTQIHPAGKHRSFNCVWHHPTWTLSHRCTCNSGDFWLRSVNVSPRACCVCTMLWKWVMSAVASLRMFSYLLLVSLKTSIWASNSKSTVREPLPNFSENICFVHWKHHKDNIGLFLTTWPVSITFTSVSHYKKGNSYRFIVKSINKL